MKRFILTLAFFAIGFGAFAQVNIPTKKEGFTAWEIQVDDYDFLLNQTRSKAKVGGLQRKDELDAYCYERCIRLMMVLLKNPEAYVMDPNISGVECHKDFTKIENFHQSMKYKIVNPGLELDQSYNNSEGHFKARTNSKFKYYGTCSIVVSFKAINPDYNPNAISQKYIQRQLLISYEAFE